LLTPSPHGSGDDRRIDAEEFAAGLRFVGLSLSPSEAAEKFAAIDTNGGGQVRSTCTHFVCMVTALRG